MLRNLKIRKENHDARGKYGKASVLGLLQRRVSLAIIAGVMAGIGASVVPTGSALAIPQVRLIEGASSLTVTDQGTNDIGAQAGFVALSQAFGSFSINFVGAITKPLLGTATQPAMDLSSLHVSGAAGGELYIMFTETDYIGNGGPATILNGIGGVTAGTVEFAAYASATNTPFALDTLIGSSGVLTGPSFSFSDIATLALNGTYSLTTVVKLTHAPGELNSSMNSVVEIPAPGTMSIALIGGLVAMGARRRHRS